MEPAKYQSTTKTQSCKAGVMSRFFRIGSQVELLIYPYGIWEIDDYLDEKTLILVDGAGTVFVDIDKVCPVM